MDRVYRVTQSGGIESTIVAKNAKEAKLIAKANNKGLPIIQTVCDLFSSNLGADIEIKKKELTKQMQLLALDFIKFVRETEKDGVEELVDYKFFTNRDYCHVGLSFSSLVDEYELKEAAKEFLDAISLDYLTTQEKTELLVNNVKNIDVFTDDIRSFRFSLIRKKNNWEKINISNENMGCLTDKSKALCDRCDNYHNCISVKTILSDKDVLALLEENSFTVSYDFNTTKDLTISVLLI